jgi:hypothetical protein
MPNLILLTGKRFASSLADRKGKQLPHSVKTISIQSLPGQQLFPTNSVVSEFLLRALLLSLSRARFGLS